MTSVAKFGRIGIENVQVDLTDNNTEYIVVGDATVDKEIRMDYSFQLPIGKRSISGQFVFTIDGITVGLEHEYSFIPPEMKVVTYSASIVGTEVRLTIVTDNVGENPKLVYRKDAVLQAAI